MQGAWILRRAVADRARVDQVPSVLHAGEREAIALAQELNAQLLIDEERGREVALARGLSVIRSLRVLAEAKRHGFIAEVRSLVAELLTSGYWIEEDVIRAFLQEMNEKPLTAEQWPNRHEHAQKPLCARVYSAPRFTRCFVW
jgi:hypothetical protein